MFDAVVQNIMRVTNNIAEPVPASDCASTFCPMGVHLSMPTGDASR